MTRQMASLKHTFTLLDVERSGIREVRHLPTGPALRCAARSHCSIMLITNDRQCNYSNYPTRSECKVCETPQRGKSMLFFREKM